MGASSQISHSTAAVSGCSTGTIQGQQNISAAVATVGWAGVDCGPHADGNPPDPAPARPPKSWSGRAAPAGPLPALRPLQGRLPSSGPGSLCTVRAGRMTTSQACLPAPRLSTHVLQLSGGWLLSAHAAGDTGVVPTGKMRRRGSGIEHRSGQSEAFGAASDHSWGALSCQA